MKKNTTGSKTSLRRIPVEEQSMRPQRKPKDSQAARINPSAVSIVKCNNCQVMVERELMVRIISFSEISSNDVYAALP